MPLAFAGLMCHAPIVIPEVAGSEAHKCVRTTRAMREMGQRVVRSRPDRVVLISPHSPRNQTRFAAWSGVHRGDLADFRAPHLRIELPDAPEVAQALQLPPVGPPHTRPPTWPNWLDHGAMVPLHFLWAAGWRGPTAILALPWSQAPDSEALGRSIAALAGRTALVASGDMSHRLIPGAPAGHHPRAKDFDRGFVQALKNEDWGSACAVPWREQAAEDVVDSTRVAMGAAGAPLHAEVLSYEGPWGVGYTQAVLYDPAPPLYAVARCALTAHVDGRTYAPPTGGPTCFGTFVTLRRDGALRGCIGRIGKPTNGTYAQVVDNAVGAASKDHRFSPIARDEVADLDIEVSVLTPPEHIDGIGDLDPAVFGVIVHCDGKRGVMLPDVQGIETASQQVRLTCKKVGIDPTGRLELQRFQVSKEVAP
jgi:AmmeMemoRadiSam system protein A